MKKISIENFKKLSTIEKQKYLKELYESEAHEQLSLIEVALKDKDVGVRFWAKKNLDKHFSSSKNKKQNQTNSLLSNQLQKPFSKSTSPVIKNISIEEVTIENIILAITSTSLDTKKKLEQLEEINKLSPEGKKKCIFKILSSTQNEIIIATTFSYLKYIPLELWKDEELEKLKKYLKHDDARVRANFIENIGPILIEKNQIDDLLLSLNDSDNRVLGNLIPLISKIDKDLIYRKLEEMLNSPSIWYNLSAAYALTLLPYEKFLPLINIARQKKHPDIQKFAKKAMAKLTEIATSKPLMEEFIETLKDPSNLMYDVAKNTIEKIIKYPSLPDFSSSQKENMFFLLMDIFLEKGMEKETINMYKILLKNHPDNVDYLLKFASYLVSIQKLDKAQAIYKKALEKDKNNLIILKTLSHLSMLQNKLDEAQKYIEKILELSPQNFEANFELAQILYLKGEYEKVTEISQKIINLSPKFKPYALKLIFLSMLKLKFYDIAENFLEQFIAESFNFPPDQKLQLFLELAESLNEDGKYSFSIKLYKFLLENFPELASKLTPIIKTLEEKIKEGENGDDRNLEKTIIEVTSSPSDQITEVNDSNPYKTSKMTKSALEEELSRILSPRYYDLTFISKGGMGYIFSAIDSSLKRKVAIKLLSPDFSNNQEFVKRFEIEILTISRLNHPNIVRIYDFQEVEDFVFYIMEFVEGITLKEHLSEVKKLPSVIFKKWGLQILDAIGYAHRNNIIHRDIKPHNMMIDEEKNIKIMDFGLAKCEDIIAGLTRVGSIMGTAFYMSPEQILGKEVDFTTDIYAIGATFYEMLTGRPPFVEGDIKGHHLRTRPIPPSQINKSLNKEYDKIVLKCLEKEPYRRYQSCQEVMEDLKKL